MIRTGKAGSGTYGIVYNAETTDKINVAVKRNIVDDSVNFSGSIKELDLLNRLKGHPYIVNLLSVSFGNPLTTPNSPISRAGHFKYREDYLHFIFEQANVNGHSLIYGEGVHISYLKLAMFQMFLGIEYMHSKEVIHRDIKPANMLWFVGPETTTSIKICDFGLAKVNNIPDPMTPRVVTCWYRAPEICAKDPNYTYSSDIWSAGCVLFEMIAKKALLTNSADDDVKLLSKIIGLIPDPTYDDIYKLTQSNKIKLTADASPRHRHSFKELINLSDKKIEEFNQYPVDGASYEEFLDLLNKILVLDPSKRLTASQALEHPFFNPYRETINSTRINHPPIPTLQENVNIVCCIERAWACKAAFLVFNNRSYLPWYKHQMLFQSIDVFDRYLTYNRKTTVKRLVPSKLQGRYLTRYQAELYYLVCLYMCIKYFTTLHIPISFNELATENYKTEKAILEAEEYEKKMIGTVLHFSFYRETIYESAIKLKREKSNENNENIINKDITKEDITKENVKENLIKKDLIKKDKKELTEVEIRDMLDKYGNIPNDINVSLADLTSLLFDK